MLHEVENSTDTTETSDAEMPIKQPRHSVSVMAWFRNDGFAHLAHRVGLFGGLLPEGPPKWSKLVKGLPRAVRGISGVLKNPAVEPISG